MKRTILMVVVGVLLAVANVASAVLGSIHFRDGGVHDINYPTGGVVVHGTTTVNLLAGGFIGGNLQVVDSAHANILGGGIGVMGDTHGSDLRVEENGTATISGGEIERVLLFDLGSIIMDGGLIGSPGVIAALLFKDSSMVISGGRINGASIRVGSFPNIYESSVLTIAGPSLRVNGSPVDNGVFYSLRGELGTDYRVTGYLDSGDYINTVVQVFDNSQLVIIPEPTTLLLLGFGGMALLRTRRHG